ncbi:MAG: FAD-dependent oxidoreductase [Pseudomonadota bacterium]
MDLTDSRKIVIVGGGQAAAQSAASLRLWGYTGDLTIVGDEAALPYQRPPLSKAYLKGEMGEERLYFKPNAWFAEHDVNMAVNTRATAIDRSERMLKLSDDGSLPYDALILSTGSRPRTLPVPGADLKGVHDLRTLADVDHLRPLMAEGRSIVIIGAGYIGLETAAVGAQLGLNVTVLEMADRVLARVTSPLISAFYHALHTRNGVDIRTGARVSGLIGNNTGHVTGVSLDDGETVAADLVLAGIGIVPNVELASDAGIACDDGILVDRDARTNDARIFAAGDCARRPLVHYGRTGRLESVHNAIEQGKLAAAAITGQARPAEDVPWFWSDQYDVKLQIAGLSEGHDQVVVRGDPDSGRFAAFYLKQDALLAVDAVNAAPEFLASKKLIQMGANLARADLSDMSISMKQIAANAKQAAA